MNTTKPVGLEHHSTDLATLKIPHWIIKEHQEAFPDLAERMRNNTDTATKIYSAFVSIIILKAKGRLTPDLKMKILKEFRVIK